MSMLLRSWQAVAAVILTVLALIRLPMFGDGATTPPGNATLAIVVILALIGAFSALLVSKRQAVAAILFVTAHAGAWLLFSALLGNEGQARAPFFLLIAALWLLAWACVTQLSALRPESREAATLVRLLIPAIFGAWVLILWEAATRGFGIPFILLPPPSAIGARIANSLPVLAADVRQTIFKAVLFGYVVGSGAGFVVAILADRVDFLRRGLLPIGNFVSALPIIGIAPIMVIWFGFDWQSKAAVVIIMTFFPMLVNTVAGLTAAGHMERDLMRTYASNYWQTLFKLRLPAAMPFIFNALKINSTLALIGAIVAEFFGTPIVGMGFRISTEIGRLNLDMVWAEIAVAALAGSVFYGAVALAERATTFWHPSIRGG
ncbi:ABC transporter permease [Oricola nitratireducens]|uniref:ABC transporter permease n=1 Tax=Oricola nitratireducens TaxID=2775868 RepID=UPI001868DF0E|nr:ABC transporter permease [Oricola nitratireducens]